MFQLKDLRCEFSSNPLGLATASPRFSWTVEHTERAQFQSAYQILVASTEDRLEALDGDLWDSGKQPTAALPLIEYSGQPLVSRQRAYWKVRVWGAQGRPSPYSPPAWFELGLLTPDDWTAEWIGYPAGWNGKALYFRASFRLDKQLATARAYVCGLGWYELHINGAKVGEHVLDPAPTDYRKRVLYSTYDITPLLNNGQNVIGAVVGNGWYGTPKWLAQIELHFVDGTLEQWVTGRAGQGGTTWYVADGPILENSVYDGEVYDARLEKSGWDTIRSEGSILWERGGWSQAVTVEAPGGQLIAQPQEPIEIIERILPQAISEPLPGKMVIDFGQNLSGWVELTVQGERGTRVTLRFAESLYNDGTVNQENLRTARASDVYFLKGEGIETWQPRFTYHGFRYVQVEGLPAPVNLQACIVRSAVALRGQFECGHPLINQLHRSVVWTEASNLMGLPTDCPQRDERMGWLNDMAARTEEALYNFDLSRLLPKWLDDIADTQDASGAIADTAPYRLGNRPADPVAVCYILIPWLLYLHHGDQRILSVHYAGMKRWVDYLTSRTNQDILEYSYYGDWAPPISEGVEGSIGNGAVARNTPGSLISTAHYYYSAVLLARIAHVLGYIADFEAYQHQSSQIFSAFNRRFWNESLGGYGSGNQACNATALYLGLVPQERGARVLTSLVHDITENHHLHLSTGNLATKYVLEVLADAGQANIALALITQTTYPSWGYMLLNGATTIWERWEKAAGSAMNSHNHPMYGSVGAWFYRWLAGIRVLDPGFSRFEVCPQILTGMTYARASLHTVRGLVASSWSVAEDCLSLAVTIPFGSQAQIKLLKTCPTNQLSIREHDQVLLAEWKRQGEVPGVLALHMDDKTVVFTVGSGEYQFQVEGI